MMFIVILIGLLIERFFDWSHLRRWQWYSAYEHMLIKKLPPISPYLTLAATIIPLLLVTALIEFILDNWLYGFAKLVFEVCVFLYCLGPKNLWADTFSSINALTQGDVKLAAEKIKSAFDRNESTQTLNLHRTLQNNIFIAANNRVFAVIFWFVLLGPVGAILYRTLSLVASENFRPGTSPALLSRVNTLVAVLNWIPVRLFTFIFALGGHFAHVLDCWRKKVLMGLNSNEALLTECGAAALGYEDQTKMPEDGSAEKNAISLLDRVFVMVLVIILVVDLIN